MVRIGVAILPEFHWRDSQIYWRQAEAMGFDHAWTYDHLTWHSFRDSAWFGAVPTLTAAAAVTDRIRLGTLVASPNFRHPVTLAKELITLDDISGGRLTLGIGAGGDGYDARTLGREAWSPAERADRFAEFLDLTDRLLRDPVTTYEGRFYSAYEARTYPGCVQRPRIPFAVAASGPRGIRLAAKYAQLWVTIGPVKARDALSPEAGVAAVAEQLAFVESACVEIGRDPGTLHRLVLTGGVLDPGLDSVEHFRDVVGRYREAGVTDLVVHWPRPSEPYRADPAVFTEAVALVLSDSR